MKRAERKDPPDRSVRARPPGGSRVRAALAHLLRWIGRHVRGFYAAVGAFLFLGLGVLVAAVLAFAGMATLVAQGATQRMDRRVMLWINSHATPWLDIAALEVTALGSTVVVWTTLIFASILFWTMRQRYSAALLWAAMLGGTVLNLTLKAGFERPRPQLFPWRTVQVGHSSFPSGHAMTAVVLYATLAYLVARLGPTRALRRLTLALALAVIVLVGLSRVYLGVHYPSDVLAGFVVGVAWATFCALGIEAVRYYRSRRPGIGSEERGLERGTEPVEDVFRHGPERRRR